jgi:predicted O-methyltransferase YrrM
MMTDPAVQAVLDEYRKRGQTEDALRKSISRQEWLRRRDEFLLEVGESVGAMLNILVREMRAGTVLEVGTSYGYSTLWLADAARAAEGKVISIDSNARKQDFARARLEKAGLAGSVEFRCGDALELIGKMTETIDLALIDLWKDLYIPCFDLVLAKAAPGAVIVADNMIFPPDNQANAEEYRAHVRAIGGMDSILLPVGHGIEISRRASR